MKKGKSTLNIGMIIIASAIIWAALIIACAFELRNTEHKDVITRYLSLAFIFHLIFIWGSVLAFIRKMKSEDK